MRRDPIVLCLVALEACTPPGPRDQGRGDATRTALLAAGEGGAQGLVMEGATVRGSVLGSVEIVRHSDSTFVDIVGEKAYRDTVQMHATCRLGRVSTANEL